MSTLTDRKAGHPRRRAVILAAAFLACVAGLAHAGPVPPLLASDGTRPDPSAPLVRVLHVRGGAPCDAAPFPDAGHRAGPRAFARFADADAAPLLTVPDASAASALRAMEYFTRYA